MLNNVHINVSFEGNRTSEEGMDNTDANAL